MLKSEFWINKIKDGDKIIMPLNKIYEYNTLISKKINSLIDIKNYKEYVLKNELIELIDYYKIPNTTMYDINGKEIKQEFYISIIENLNKNDIKDIIYVKYGIAVRNTDIRSFPDDTPVFKTPDDKDIDRFQETGCQAFEPLAVLHISKDRRWYFVQMYNYFGWIRAEDVAIGCKDEIFNYVESSDFIIVTGEHVHTVYNPYDKRISYIEFTMGTKIPIKKDVPLTLDNQLTFGQHVADLAVRDKEGNLEFKSALIPVNEDVSIGYLPYTRENILKQVFKTLGKRYGWGDSFKGRDCSSTIMYTYKCFGFKLPRNADEQELCEGISYEFTDDMTIDDRIKIFEKIKPGAAVFMDGHVMMYVGMKDKVPYIIHAFHGYGEKNKGEYEFVPANTVMVTSSLLKRMSGKTFLEEFRKVIEFESI